ncbi:MAG: hypothetical protein AAFP69_03630, partial [Planctomycetota bacterium]
CGGSVLVAPAGYAAPNYGAGTVPPQGQTPLLQPPATQPGVGGPSLAAANPAGNERLAPRPLVTLGQENYPVVVGQGFYGQPAAYVPGQSIRNFLRYLTP